MTDIHTHILPGMDDGARNVQESLDLLRMEREQGVDTVVLTPHFYPSRESMEQFLRRRAEAFQTLQARIGELPEQERAQLPRLVLGAEVAWRPNLRHCEDLSQLCMGQSRNILLELPFQMPWTNHMVNDIYDLIGKFGVTPVIAHIERYIGSQNAKLIEEVLALGVPVQISSDMFRHFRTRKKALRLLEKRQVHVVASDCHNTTDRAPGFVRAMQVIRRKLGEQRLNELLHSSDALIR